ncbi:OmpA family protein [Seonamhaeicola aphaedonensis]|uniref:WD40 repeat protein n=1 Tax=Seonamhaeicola aphaedonensis TaxID=1461338 RepID=A0A3D9HIP9_9FLAO|nr:OmpA family protein [Seonamhaeicola aphaedonensis]RED49305.1 WD40 repeat protein [Seonamhaeicola aphaedonensis]
MKLKNYILVCILLTVSLTASAQYGKQKKADTLFNKFSFVKATETYLELLENKYNEDYVVRRLADCYALMRDAKNAAKYYKKAVAQENVPIEYYYNYAQALRGIEKYDESKEWMKRYQDSGGVVNTGKYLKKGNFITNIFNAKQQYFLSKFNHNSKLSDFGAYEYNGKIYFASTRDEGVSIKRLYGWNEQPFLDVYAVDKDSKEPADHTSKLKGDVNSIYHDGPVTITNDGNTMYFTRNSFIKNVYDSNSKGINQVKIYRATLKDSIWSDVEDLSINDSEFSTQHPALSPDNKKLYFASDRPGGVGASDIYVVDINDDGSLGEPKNLGNVVNTSGSEGMPFINNEGSLFFSSDGHVGLGMLDIFGTITNEDDEIVDVINLGVPVNSSKDDFSFTMNEDGLTGYFASNRPGGKGDDDIYAYNRVPLLNVEGVVTDIVNKKPVPNAIITLLDGNGKQIAYMETDEEGYYEINIDRDVDYKITASQKKYEDDVKEFTSKGIEPKVTTITANLELTPVRDVPILADLGIIYFDFDKHNIRPDAAVELDKIVKLMNETYPGMVIRIESHTDSRGTLSYNDKLSIDRANSTYQYLIDNGVDAARITAHEGFGERRLTNGCDGSVNCEENSHQLNRRTEFIIIKME